MNIKQTLVQTLCTEPCLWVGNFVDWCAPLRTDASIDTCSLYTWVPEKSIFVYIIKILGFTLAYVPDQKMTYFVHPSYNLRDSCPANSMFLCQLYQNDDESEVRLLYVDVMYLNDVHILKPAKEHYNILMGLGPHIPSEWNQIQWCGNKDAITPVFLQSLPHTSTHLFGLSDDVGMGRLEQLSFWREIYLVWLWNKIAITAWALNGVALTNVSTSLMICIEMIEIIFFQTVFQMLSFW